MTESFTPTRSRIEGTASAANSIQRVAYSHDAMIDLIMECPDITQNLIAANFGYTVPWVSRVINSDAFQVRLAERKQEMIDPGLLASIEENLKEVTQKSLAVIKRKLDAAPTMDQALKAVEVTTKCLGYGARQADQTNTQLNFVVQMPDRVEKAVDWQEKFAPKTIEAAIETKEAE